MEKVKLTQEQADAIEHALNNVERYKTDRDYLVIDAESYSHDYVDGCFGGELFPLNKLQTWFIAKALYVGYEVEPEFKVGDWVYNENTERTAKVTYIQEYEIGTDDGWVSCGAWRSNIRHATPEEIAKEKQRRWWAKHGREVWELKVGDVLINSNNIPFVVVKVEDDRIHFQNKGWVYRKELGEWLVICFAEDREDIGRNNE